MRHEAVKRATPVFLYAGSRRKSDKMTLNFYSFPECAAVSSSSSNRRAVSPQAPSTGAWVSFSMVAR